MDRLAEHNVVLVTLDSCRYDVAVAAHTPNLDRLGPLLACETAGTYTLPAHMALFTGRLPTPADGRYYLGSRELTAVWRSAAARPAGPADRVGVRFDGRTLMDGYRRRGFNILGVGGVGFFDPADPANLLPTLFDRFRYVGRPNRAGGDTSRIVDRTDTLALQHVDKIAAECLAAGRFFLFVNCASTHVPYTTPAGRLTDDLAELLQRLYRLHDTGGPGRVYGDRPDLTDTDRAVLLDLQRRALEWADRQLGHLMTALAPAAPLVVVCADHGEAFGEDGRYGHGNPHLTVTTVPLWCGLLGNRAP